MDQLNKFSTYLGFAIKSGSVIFGIDSIVKLKRTPPLVIFCSEANKKIVGNFDIEKMKCIQLNQGITLNNLASRNNVRVVAVKDFGLAKAMLSQSDVFQKLI